MNKRGSRLLVQGAIVGIVVTVCAAATAHEPSDQKEPAHQLELGGRVGATVLFSDPANPEYQNSFSRWGFGFGATLLYRSPYFLRPFVDVSYASLARGTASVEAASFGGPATIEQSLDVWNFSPGLAFDVWRLRFFATLGLSVVGAHNDINGAGNASSQWAISSQLGLSGLLYEHVGIHVRGDLRLVNVPGADTHYLTLSCAIDVDLLR